MKEPLDAVNQFKLNYDREHSRKSKSKKPTEGLQLRNLCFVGNELKGVVIEDEGKTVKVWLNDQLNSHFIIKNGEVVLVNVDIKWLKIEATKNTEEKGENPYKS